MALIQGPVRNRDILEFWNEHRIQIYKLLYRTMDEKHLIPDLMQNVYIRLHTHFEEVRNLENPCGWLLKVARNICMDEYRQLIRHRKVRESYFPYVVEKVRRVPFQLENASRLNSLLDSLPPHQGTLVELHYLKGFSIDELSEISGMSRSTVSKRIVTSVGKMRKNVLKSVKAS